MTGRPDSLPEAHPAVLCPGCGTGVPDGKTGRRRVYCGDACRKAVFRKKQSDLGAIQQARWLRGQILAAWREVQKEIATLSSALQSMMQAQDRAEADGNQEDRDALLERGTAGTSSSVKPAGA